VSYDDEHGFLDAQLLAPCPEFLFHLHAEVEGELLYGYADLFGKVLHAAFGIAETFFQYPDLKPFGDPSVD